MHHLICLIGLFTGLYCSTATAEMSALMRARVGIQINRGQQAALAKNDQNLRPGDQLRIYVIPENEAFLYVVHSDLAKATLMNHHRAGMKQSELILPSRGGFYEVDGNSAHEVITIVCSRREIKALSGLFSRATIPHQEWKTMEQKLFGQNRVGVNQKIEKPMAIAGNVRGISPAAPDEFIKRLRAYSGQTVLVKTYAFTVQK